MLEAYGKHTPLSDQLTPFRFDAFSFQINNNLETYITVLHLTGTAGQNGVTYAEFDHEFATPFTTEAGQNPGGYSEQVPTKLTQGAVGSLPLLANIAAGLDIVSLVQGDAAVAASIRAD